MMILKVINDFIFNVFNYQFHNLIISWLENNWKQSFIYLKKIFKAHINCGSKTENINNFLKNSFTQFDKENNGHDFVGLKAS